MQLPPRGISSLLFAIAFAFITSGSSAATAAGQAQQRPNILWLVAEDMNPHLGCYGDTNAITPNIDRLAAGALRYTKCWSTAPVCAPARTALIAGIYPSSTGGEHMRSEVRLPDFIKLYPQLLAEAGYYCVNKSKEDYNVTVPGKVWAESSPRAHYRNRQQGQPFFAAFNMEITHESQIRSRPHTLQHDPARMRLPAYHPDLPEVRRDWAQYYDKVTAMDSVVGKHLRELDELGLTEDTIVFFYGDNGCGMPRSKRWPYNSGLHVPLIVRIPEKWNAMRPADYRPGATTDRLVSFVDFAPTLVNLAGGGVPNWMHGRPFLGPNLKEGPQYLHGLRGRMDERYDFVRSVRNDRYVYVRNYMPHRIYGQYLEYMFETPTTRVWKEQYEAGALREPQTRFWEPKPAEELYDLSVDQDEVRNLATSPEHAHVLSELRQALREHAIAVRDSGFLPEAEMHERAKGSTIYEMARLDAAYPIREVISMADAASGLASNTIPGLMQGLSHNDSAVRYWAAMGLLMRGKAGFELAREQLKKASQDAAPSVRVVAAEALARYGSAEEQDAGLAALKQLLSPQKNGAYVSVMALNSVANLGSKADSLKDYLRDMPKKDPGAPARVNSYVERLVKDVLSGAGQGSQGTRTALDSPPATPH